jgi:hypothetical protein
MTTITTSASGCAPLVGYDAGWRQIDPALGGLDSRSAAKYTQVVCGIRFFRSQSRCIPGEGLHPDWSALFFARLSSLI